MPSGDGFGQVWRWPLYSPRRFFSCIAVVLALIAVSNMALGGRGGKPQGQPAASASPGPGPGQPSGTPTDTTDTSAPAGPAEPGESTPPVTPTASPKAAVPGAAQHAEATALSFTREWVNHTRPAAQWLAAIRRYADPEFAAQLGTADPANVPASRVTGLPHAVSVFYASATVEVPTDSGVMVVELVSDGRSWRVVDMNEK